MAALARSEQFCVVSRKNNSICSNKREQSSIVPRRKSMHRKLYIKSMIVFMAAWLSTKSNCTKKVHIKWTKEPTPEAWNN